MSHDSSQVLKAVAHPVRVQILHELAFRDGAARVTGVADALGLAPNSVSYHLRALAKAGVVEKIDTPPDRDARETWYSLSGGGVDLGFDGSQVDERLPGLVDLLHEATVNSSVVGRYRRAAMEASEVPGERLVGLTTVLRLTPKEQGEFYALLRNLVEYARRKSEQNMANVRSGEECPSVTSQVLLNLESFPIVHPSEPEGGK